MLAITVFAMAPVPSWVGLGLGVRVWVGDWGLGLGIRGWG